MSEFVVPLPRTEHPCASEELTRAITENYDFVWRTLRRLGVPERDTDDGVQRVFLVTSRKWSQIQPGKLRGFLFGVARRIARDARRELATQPSTIDIETHVIVSDQPLPDEAEEMRRRRAWLDIVLQRMDEPLRVVFLLSDIEELPMREIAEVLGIPAGTVASRLRRARNAFHAEAAELRRKLIGATT